jgi:hypothetical protein
MRSASMMRTRVGIAGLVVVVCILLASCSSDSSTSVERTTSANGLQDFAGQGGSELESYPSMKEMSAASDLTIVGTVVSVTRGPDEGTLGTARALVRIDEVVSNKQGARVAKGGETVIAFGLGMSGDVPKLLPNLTTQLPKLRAIWSLRSLDFAYPDVYRIVNTVGIIEDDGTGQARPAFYRATAERVRNSRNPKGEVDAETSAGVILEASRMKFDAVVALARV